MRCNREFFSKATTETIENLWEVRCHPRLAARIKNLALQQKLTLSTVLRYCIFRFIEKLQVYMDKVQDYQTLLNCIGEEDMNQMKIPERKSLYQLFGQSGFQDRLPPETFTLSEIENNLLLQLMECMDLAYDERSEHNQFGYHRFVICLYGADEILIRNVAATWGITVSLLFRAAMHLYLKELEPEANTKTESETFEEMILRYGIKQSLVVKFHNKALAGGNPGGNYSIYSIFYPKWRYWPLRRGQPSW